MNLKLKEARIKKGYTAKYMAEQLNISKAPFLNKLLRNALFDTGHKHSSRNERIPHV